MEDLAEHQELQVIPKAKVCKVKLYLNGNLMEEEREKSGGGWDYAENGT